MTLDDPERPFRTLFQNACIFGAQNEIFNEDRPRLSPAKVSFWQYEVYADIRGGFLGDEASNDSGVIENVDF